MFKTLAIRNCEDLETIGLEVSVNALSLREEIDQFAK